ncbi:MAG: GGDEF domain-containing protein [Rubrivivax sp.]
MNEQEAREALRRAAADYLSAPAEALRVADEVLAAMPQHVPAQRTRGTALAYLGRFEESMATLRQALAALPEAPSADRHEVLRALSIAHEHMGAIEDSLAAALQAEEVARALADPPRLAAATLAAAVALSRAGETAAGLERYREVLAFYEAAGDHFGAMQLRNNIGIALKNLGRHEEALEPLRRAASDAADLGDSGARAVALSNLAEPLARLGRLAEALAAADEALAGLLKAGYRAGETHVRALRGQLLAALGDADAAAAEFEHTLALAEAIGSRNHVARAHLGLSALHKAAGRFEQALRHHEAYHAAERAQFNEDSARRLRALQVRFDLGRVQHEAARLRASAETLAAESRTDALTGLANRRALEERLAAAFAAPGAVGGMAAALVDIDDFKQVNDRHGHALGDEVLRRVAALLARHAGAGTLAARQGGEEFCVLFTGAPDAAAACEAMRAATEAADWAALQPGLRVTLSIGLARAEEGAADPAALLAAADRRLYAAKRQGKNRVVAAG